MAALQVDMSVPRPTSLGPQYLPLGSGTDMDIGVLQDLWAFTVAGLASRIIGLVTWVGWSTLTTVFGMAGSRCSVVCLSVLANSVTCSRVCFSESTET